MSADWVVNEMTTLQIMRMTVQVVQGT